MESKIIIKHRSFTSSIIFALKFKYLDFKMTLNQLKTGITWIITGYKGVYYDYTNKKVLELDGYQYLRRVSTDLGEMAFFKQPGKDTNCFCERF